MAAKPSEYRTVQARILAYAQEIGWTYVPCDEAERRRGFTPHPNPLPASRARECAVRAYKASLYFGDSLLPKPRALLSNREGNS